MMIWAFYPYIQHSPSDFTAQPQHNRSSEHKKVRREERAHQEKSYGFSLFLVCSAGPCSRRTFFIFCHETKPVTNYLGIRPRRMEKAKPQRQIKRQGPDQGSDKASNQASKESTQEQGCPAGCAKIDKASTRKPEDTCQDKQRVKKTSWRNNTQQVRQSPMDIQGKGKKPQVH